MDLGTNVTKCDFSVIFGVIFAKIYDFEIMAVKILSFLGMNSNIVSTVQNHLEEIRKNELHP